MLNTIGESKMNATHSARQLLPLLTRAQLRSTRAFATFGRAPKSPFLELFSRHTARPTIRHQLLRRKFTTRARLRNEAPDAPNPALQTSKSLSQRLKDLSKEYGWTALAVYLALSALDFPFCFIAVRWIGTEKIAALEHSVVEWVKQAIPVQIPEKYQFWKKTKVSQEIKEAEGEFYDHGYVEAEKANRGEGASLGTQLALAYAIHKSFIFIRVPLTAAVLPKIVKTLRGWGWNIGRGKSKVDAVALKAAHVKVDTTKAV